MIIRDPSTGVGTKVTDEGCLCNKAITIPLIAHTNTLHEECYSILVDQAIAGAAHFFYIKNSSDTLMRIRKIRGFVTADIELYLLRAVTGTATTPSDLIPVNRNFGSGKTADGTFQQGAALALTNGNEIDRWIVDFSQDPSFEIEWKSELILPKNQTLVLAGSAAAAINATVSIYFHDD